MIREQLERNHGQQRLDDLRGFRDRQENVGQRLERTVTGGADSDDPAVAGPDFLHVGERLRVQRALRSHEHAGRAGVDQSDRAVLHLGCGIAFGVNVADLLQLECSLERDGIVQVSSEVESTSRGSDQPRGLFDGRLRLQDFTHERRDRLDRIDDGHSIRKRKVPQPRQMERQQEQDGHLRGERLGAGDSDLEAGVKVNPALGLAGDRAADRVHDRQRGMAAALGFAQCAERIGRFARLAEDEDQRLFLERGVAVAKLAGEFHLDG